MNLKKICPDSYGYQRVVTSRNSTLTFEEMDVLKLCRDGSFTVREQGKEFALVVLWGTVTVKGKDFCFERVGTRKSVFDGVGEAVYVGLDTEFTVEATGGEAKVVIGKAPATVFYPPQVARSGDIQKKELGKGAYTRLAAFNVAENIRAQRIYIGEFWVEDGNWASFPPHKHDVQDLPTEGFSDEIYYFEFDKPQGFGVQMVYTKEGDIEEAYRVKSGELVEVPKGYHPFTVAPGYKNYCLWLMAGDSRGLFPTVEEDHRWINR